MSVMFTEQEIDQLPYPVLRTELLRLQHVPMYSISQAYLTRLLTRAELVTVPGPTERTVLEHLIRPLSGNLARVVRCRLPLPDCD